MSLKTDEIAAIIKEQIRNYHRDLSMDEEGKVISIGDGIALVYGLSSAEYGEILKFDDGSLGLVLNLQEDVTGVVLLGNDTTIKEGDLVYRTKEILKAPTGDSLLGRVVNAIGIPIDGQKKLENIEYFPIESPAPEVMARSSVSEPLETGLLAIDALVPIGLGQRELIIGDRQTGKTAIAIDAIINQKGKGIYCVYVAIGQKNSSIAQIVEKLKKYDALSYTVVLSASASDPASLQYIAPYTGVTMAEAWMNKGEDVLIIYDDLSKHAVAYRTLSLLLRRPPGREAYPGDIFFIHSRLLERAAKLTEERGGSITALPIIETQAGDISAYIPTNVISITDGQIFLMDNLFNSGQRPAVDAGLSVSRVGGAAQIPAIKGYSSSLKLELAQYFELQAFAQFGSDLDKESQIVLSHGKRVLNFLKQSQYCPIDQSLQIVILFAIKNRIVKWIPETEIIAYREYLTANFPKVAPRLFAELRKKQKLTPKIEAVLKRVVLDLTEKFIDGVSNYDVTLYGSKEEFKKYFQKVKGK